MLGSAFSVLLIALAALRFPDIPLLAILPAVLATAIAAALPPHKGAWIAGLLAGALLFRLPGSVPLALVTAAFPVLALLLQRFVPTHPGVRVGLLLPLAAYAAAGAGSGSLLIPLGHALDLCAAVALGATLGVLTYAPTERERLGPRGRAGLRVR